MEDKYTYVNRTDGKPICFDCCFKVNGYTPCQFNNSSALYPVSCSHYIKENKNEYDEL